MNNKVLLYSPGNYIQYPVINHNGKEYERHKYTRGLPRWLSGRESTYQVGDTGSIPGSGRSPGVGNGTPLQFSCLGNPMDRGAWRAAGLGVAESDAAEYAHAPACMANIATP